LWNLRWKSLIDSLSYFFKSYNKTKETSLKFLNRIQIWFEFLINLKFSRKNEALR
jgi:hypothetical protein